MAQGITVDFNANLVKFSGQVDKAIGQLDKFEKSSQNIAARVNSALSGIGVGISAAGLAAFVKSGIDAADALNDLSSRSGIAVENLSAMQLAIKLGDTDMQSFVTASNKLSINIAKNAENFAALGISAKDPLEAFKQLSNAYSAIDDPQTRAAFGAAALGKAYAEMAPLLDLGSAKINELIESGKKSAGISAEQAARAGEFNDRLDEMANSSQGFRIKFAIGVLDPLSAFATEIDKAIDKSGVFIGTLEGLSNGFNKFILESNGAGGGLTEELDALNRKIAAAKQKVRDTRSTATDKAPVEIQAAKTLNDLESQRKTMLQQISVERRKDLDSTVKASAEVLAFDKALNDLIFKSNDGDGEKPKRLGSGGSRGGGGGSGGDAALRAEQSRLDAVNNVIAALKQDIEVSKVSENQQQRLIELSNSLKVARGEEVGVITDLVNKKYTEIEADKRQSAQWEQMIEDANAYYDLRKDINTLSKSNLTIDGLSGGIGQVQDQLSAGIINAEQAKALYDELGRGYNESFIEPAKNSTNELSEYGIQAARNMQTAFADFLFDPFEKSTTSMAESFVNTLKRMAADAASAGLMDALFGQPGKKDGGGLTGTILNAVIGGIGGAFGGGATAAASTAAGGTVNSSAIGASINKYFADGGVMTSFGPMPLKRYATGGVATSPQMAIFGEGAQPEAYVPLPDGRSIPVTMRGGSGDVQISTTVNVNGNSNQQSGQALGEIINARIKQVIVTEKRPGGLLA